MDLRRGLGRIFRRYLRRTLRLHAIVRVMVPLGCRASHHVACRDRSSRRSVLRQERYRSTGTWVYGGRYPYPSHICDQPDQHGAMAVDRNGGDPVLLFCADGEEEDK
jgi:hypothetical protein